MALPVYVRIKVFSGNTGIDRLICALLDRCGIDASPVNSKYHGDILEGVRLILSGLFIEDPNAHMEEIVSTFPECYRQIPIIGMTANEIYRFKDASDVSPDFAELGVRRVWYQLHGAVALLGLIEEQLDIDLFSEVDEEDITTFNNLLSCLLAEIARSNKAGTSTIPDPEQIPGSFSQEVREKLFPSRSFMSALRGTAILKKAA